jgi:phosphate-selective porin OprO/OprP
LKSPALRGLGLGFAGTYVDVNGDTISTLLPSYRTPGQQTFFSYRVSTAAIGPAPGTNATLAAGRHVRWTAQLYYYVGPFGVLGEYVDSSQDVTRSTPGAGVRSARLDNSAWQIQISTALTGEEESYNKAMTPRSPFVPDKHTWGAFELVARYQELRIDPGAFTGGVSSFADPARAARKARGWGVGVNWYLNLNLKWSLDYDVTSLTGGAPGGADRPTERAEFMRFALAF